jgi:Domain of unknown function (DUF4271)
MLFNLHTSVLSASIPSELATRDSLFSYEVGIVLFVSFLLIAFARLARPNIYLAMSVGMLKTTSVRAHIKETFPLNKMGSIFLLINYLFSSALIVYLCLSNFDLYQLDRIVISLAAPFALLVGNLLSMITTGWLTGEYEVLKAPLIMKILGAQSIGLIYFMCALIWVLNSDYQNILIQVAIWTFIIESALRIFKSIMVVYTQGVSWYYIILYFCTLEILPLFVVYYFVLQNLVD